MFCILLFNMCYPICNMFCLVFCVIMLCSSTAVLLKLLVNIFVHFLVKLVLCILSKSIVWLFCVVQHPPSEIHELIYHLLPGYSRYLNYLTCIILINKYDKKKGVFKVSNVCSNVCCRRCHVTGVM